MALYEKLEYELEFITPAFIGGAFPDREAELRPASFIGILRWWFRNLALTVTDDIEAIAHLESELFGNQNRAGKVWVKVKRQEPNRNGKTKEKILESQLILTNSSIGRCNQGNENIFPKLQQLISYDRRNNTYGTLTYTTFGLDNNRLAIWGKVYIELILPSKYNKIIKYFLALLNFIGTIGSKRTKGWGSFKLIKKHSDDNDDETATADFKNLFDKFQNELLKLNINLNPENSVKELKIFKLKNFKLANCLNGSNQQAYPGLNLLSYVALAYKLFRFKLPPDYSEASRFLRNPQRNVSIIYNRVTVGLPISNISTRHYRNRRRINISQFLYLNKSFNRLANPFIFKIMDDESILIIVFKPKILSKVLDKFEVVGKYEVKNRQWQRVWDLNIRFGFTRDNNRFYENFSEEQSFLLEKLGSFLNQMFDVEEIYPAGN